MIRYLSICSGIEAATQAWHPLGWSPVAFSEIEPFPCAVLAHHYPAVPNWGDMTRFEEWPDADVDVLCGGTPCQSFSVAGLRKGLADPRGNLMLTFGAIAARYRPRWLVWENVPGVLSSNGGRDFGAFLGMLGELGYGVAYRVLDAQHVRTRRFPWAVPQRRRRVFVVGYLGDWRRAAAVLFDRESLSGHPAPRRETGKRPAPTLAARTNGGGGLGTDFDLDGGLIQSNSGDVGYCLTASAQQSLDAETETLLAVAHDCAPAITSNPYGDHESREGLLVAHSLRAEGFDASEDGTGRGTPIVPVTSLAFQGRGSNLDVNGEIAGTLGTNADRASGGAPMVAQAVAFDLRGREGGAMPEGPHDTANIRAASGGSSRSYVAQAYGIRSDASRSGEALTPSADAEGRIRLRNPGLGIYEGLSPTVDASQPHAVATPWAVRRLTPCECERLMGFPDNFTRIPWRGKPADLCPDGHRYKALGNSWAVNCAEWLGERVAEVDAWGIKDVRAAE